MPIQTPIRRWESAYNFILDQYVLVQQLSEMIASFSAPGCEGLVHQPQHRYQQERPVADCRGLRGILVCNLTAGSSDWSPQLLQECLQVGGARTMDYVLGSVAKDSEIVNQDLSQPQIYGRSHDCDDCFMLPSTLRPLNWKNMNLAICQYHNDVPCLYVDAFVLTFLNNLIQFRSKCTSVYAYFNTWPVHMHGRAHHLLLPQVTDWLRIAFSSLCKRDITDPWPISIFANANIYCTVTNTVQYSPFFCFNNY